MQRFILITVTVFLLYLTQSYALYAQDPENYFKIRVVDKETGRGVPLVEVKTTNEIRYFTDSKGLVAFLEPGLMDQPVYFHIASHGYEFPIDGYGNRGTTLKVRKGDSALIKIKRINVAERLYRITGAGIYHHSILLGLPVPIRQPGLNSQVMGQDAGQPIPYKGKLYWFWGDTEKSSYPLGNFASSAATSEWPDKDGLDPDVGIDLTYFVNESGFSKAMLPSTEIPGPGLRWIFWLMTIKDEKGIEHLLAQYERIKNLGEAYERGIAIFNDETETFQRLVQFDLKAPLHPTGRPFQVTIGEQHYYYFAVLYANSAFVRVKADLEHIKDPNRYEAFTCLVAGSRYNNSLPNLDRGADGHLIYAWKANTAPISYGREQELIAAGHMRPEEAWFQLKDIDSGDPVKTWSGSVQWNDFRQQWVMIVQQNPGEVWYAEGATPIGPWAYAKKIVTHNKYSFYLPTHHRFFDKDSGKTIYFEGTYTNAFSGNPDKTPRYDYNQIMYRLSLDDTRLFLPVPIYQIRDIDGMIRLMLREEVESLNAWEKIEKIPFYALPPDRKRLGTIPIYSTMEKGILQNDLPSSKSDQGEALFYGLPKEITISDKHPFAIWKCNVDGYQFTLEINIEDQELEAKMSGFEFKSGKIEQNQLEIHVIDNSDKVEYTLTAQIEDGKLIGKYVADDSGESETWEGERVDFAWQQFISPDVVPLYMYQKKDGLFIYSTDPNLSGMKRSEKPICKVWKNPSSILSLDFKAKPVPLVK